MAESVRLDENLCWEIAVIQRNKHGETVCGDHVAVTRNGDSVRFVLSDGLGSGIQANIASTLTATLLSGLPLEEGVRAVAAVLPVTKRQGLAYATFNIASTVGRELRLTQFDSPQAVFFRDGVSLDYPVSTRTVLDKPVQESTLTMKSGDMLILFSDGVSEAGRGVTTRSGWGRREMEDYLFRSIRPDDHARYVAASIVSTVQALDLFDYHDDTSVAVLRLRERLGVNLLLGPSDGWTPDADSLRRFFAEEGSHAILGNGAVKAAAAYLGTSVRVLRHTVTETLPPLSFIEGVELTAEGEQTFQAALSGLERYREDGMLCLDICLAQDGASRLVNLLAEEASEVSILYHPGTDANQACYEQRTEQVLRLRDTLCELGKSVKLLFI